MKIGWSDDLLVLDGRAAALPQIERVDAGHAAWVLIHWVPPGRRQPWVYALSRDEFFRRLGSTTVPYRPGTRATLSEVFRLHELAPSQRVDPGMRPVELRSLAASSGAATVAVLSGWRCADWPGRSDAGAAVGGPDVGLRLATRSAPPLTRGGGPPPTNGGAPPTRGMPTPAAPDEGTRPLRFPSIEPEAAVRTGQPVVLVVDLLREESATTLGGAMALPELAADWSTLAIDVALSSPDIDFDDDGRATLEIRRNAASRAARIGGRVHAGLPPGHAIQVKARFLLDNRLCGSALRLLGLEASAGPAPPPDTPPAVVQIDTAAVGPDLTVEISIPDPDNKPTRLAWSMWPRPFPGRPARLNGAIQLGQRPDAEASALFHRFANLQRGEHQQAIEGFGEELWSRSPPEFQALYWAMCDHFGRAFTIQFITDDPHMPWELMNPYRPGEQHGPIALRHAVARWLVSYKGYLENRLPKGRVLAMAPHYDAGRDLPLAEAAAQALVDQVGAQRVDGKRARLLQLLESPPPERVALLFFTGHGAFSTDTAGASRLKLEDGLELTPMEVKRQKVTLGQRDGTVVFLNACEVGATGSVLGNVGGWADAFLAREFRAFIAPLWAIDEEDAAQVTAELMQAIVTRQQPLGEALRDLRAKYGAVSPTFYSYLLYGDVTARLGTA
jgi:hypothetical protein